MSTPPKSEQRKERPQKMRFLIGEGEAGERLDRALAAVAGVARAQARRWIDEGRVRLDGRVVRAARRVAMGDELEANPPEPVRLDLVPEPIPLCVLYEDADLIVIDKPPGLVVQPAPGQPRGTLVHALLHHCGDLAGIGGVLRPGIVHRLDRGTSGVLVAAKHDAAHRHLAEQFREHTVERVYLAVVRGVPGAEEGRVERAIGRHRRDRKRMSVQTESGREARTVWRVARRFPSAGYALLEVRPETGRTHQIRVHLAAAGLPIVGDPVYGRARRAAIERPALHAAVLGFTHPRSGERLRFEAPPAPDFAALLAGIEKQEAAA
jgi:23S rRNA pseudouridine1911/1915/1917 synthase